MAKAESAFFFRGMYAVEYDFELELFLLRWEGELDACNLDSFVSKLI